MVGDAEPMSAVDGGPAFETLVRLCGGRNRPPADLPKNWDFRWAWVHLWDIGWPSEDDPTVDEVEDFLAVHAFRSDRSCVEVKLMEAAPPHESSDEGDEE